MKTMTIENLPKHVAELVSSTAKERILLTRGGKPFALVTDASGYDEEDIGYMTDENFWQMIADRRKTAARIPLAQVKARIDRELKISAARSRRSEHRAHKGPQSKKH